MQCNLKNTLPVSHGGNRPGGNFEWLEFAGLENDRLKNDELDQEQTAAASVPGTPAAADTPSRCCEVCLLAPIEGFTLVPRGLARFCENCARRVADEGGNCPLCRAVISMVNWWYAFSRKIAVVNWIVNSDQLPLDICDWNWNCNVNYNTGTHDVLWSLYDFCCLSYF